MKIISKVRGNNPREKVLRKLATEADYLTRVQECLGVVQLYETFEDADKVYFVCELCSGGDLDSIIEVRPYQAGCLLAQALRGRNCVSLCRALVGPLHWLPLLTTGLPVC